MQQIQIQIPGAEASEARRASTRDAIAGHFVALHLGNQEYAVALIGNHGLEELLGAAAAVVSRRIEQCHAERNARAQRLFLDIDRMPALTDVPATLPKRRDGSAARKLYGARGLLRRRAGINALCGCLSGNQAEGCTTRTELTSINQMLVHGVTSFVPA